MISVIESVGSGPRHGIPSRRQDARGPTPQTTFSFSLDNLLASCAPGLSWLYAQVIVVSVVWVKVSSHQGLWQPQASRGGPKSSGHSSRVGADHVWSWSSRPRCTRRLCIDKAKGRSTSESSSSSQYHYRVLAPGAGSFFTMYSSDLFLRPASKL